jgi:hypothetical protein
MTGSSKPRSALQRYFDVLACVARADQVVVDAERGLLLAAASACDLASEAMQRLERQLDLGQPLDVDRTLADAAAGADVAVVAEVLRDAYVLAMADSDVAPAELAVIDRFLDHAGYDANGRAVMMEWARRAAELHCDGASLAAELRRR